jgi:hypothetical protein
MIHLRGVDRRSVLHIQYTLDAVSDQTEHIRTAALHSLPEGIFHVQEAELVSEESSSESSDDSSVEFFTNVRKRTHNAQFPDVYLKFSD